MVRRKLLLENKLIQSSLIWPISAEKLSQNIKQATELIEQGHVRVGPEMIKDPAFIVSRNLEDFVTWVDSSAIRKHVLEYNNIRDDFDL